MVRISTLHGSPAATMSRVASMPSWPGIRTSMSTTSGRSAEHMETAAVPSAASPTTSISVFGVEDQAEAHPDEGVVVDQEHADHGATA